MKRLLYLFFFGLCLFGLATLCACTPTAEKPYRPLSNISNATVIGTVNVSFESYFNFTKVNEAAYIALLETAKKEYHDNIDICDIVWTCGKSVEGFNMYEFSATGKVITYENENK